MIAGYAIRSFRQEDLERLHEIRAAAFKPVFESFRSLVGGGIAPVAFASAEEEQADHLNRLCDPESPNTVFVVEHLADAKLVGFCSISLDAKSQIGEIDLNAVDPEHQGQGIGSMMFEHALDQMRAAGMRVATVGTGGDPSHAPARAAYRKAGFGAEVPSVYMYRSL